MAEERPTYLSYLLRLWRVGGDEGPPVWWASLEGSHTGEYQVFASLDHLSSFLRGRTEAQLEGTVKEPPNYLSYLLRLWRVDGDEETGPVWRASLEDSRTGERVAFASLGELLEFLRNQTHAPADRR